MAANNARAVASLPVANVQALAEACNGLDGQVPERYLFAETEVGSEELVGGGGGGSHSEIPVVDLRRLLDPRSEEEECVKLKSACHHWGFFQLINHGVPDEVTGNLMRDVAEFFDLPLEAKKEWAQSPDPDSVQGYGQAFVASEDQKLEWSDMLYLQLQPSEKRDLRFWPTRPQSFRNSVEAYSSDTARLAYRLLELMAKATGADPASLRGLFEGLEQGMRMNYYPPCRQADRVLGLSPHTDASGLTLLQQMNNDVQGLQVKKDGRWFAVDVADGAFVVIVGDALEIMSNGKFTSVEHRAVVHPTKERISVALFFHPFPSMMVGPLPEFIKGDKERYRSTSYEDFMKQYFAKNLDGRNHLERLKSEQ